MAVSSNLAQGEYRLAVTRDGFIRQELSKKIILGRGQQIQNIRFELDPAPTVTGWVLDSFGEAVSNIMVEALGRTYDVRGNPRFARAATAVTDDLLPGRQHAGRREVAPLGYRPRGTCRLSNVTSRRIVDGERSNDECPDR